MLDRNCIVGDDRHRSIDALVLLHSAFDGEDEIYECMGVHRTQSADVGDLSPSTFVADDDIDEGDDEDLLVRSIILYVYV